jgi:hypothetical protein
MLKFKPCKGRLTRISKKVPDASGVMMSIKKHFQWRMQYRFKLIISYQRIEDVHLHVKVYNFIL